MRYYVRPAIMIIADEYSTVKHSYQEATPLQGFRGAAPKCMGLWAQLPEMRKVWGQKPQGKSKCLLKVGVVNVFIIGYVSVVIR